MAGFVGQIYLERGDGSSPETFTRVCQVYDMTGIGETNTEEDVTTFCSYPNREYIAGLADGTQPSFTLLYERNNATIRAMIADCKDKTNRNYRLAVESSGVAVEYFYMTLVPLSWELGPSIEGKNSIVFGSRISGAIDIQNA